MKTDQPTTVRGWLETLPEPLRTKALADVGSIDYNGCASLQEAVKSANGISNGRNDYYWKGVLEYLEGFDFPCPAFAEGYNAAKSAYEAKKFVAGLPPIPTKPEVRDCCRCGSTLPKTEFEGFEQVCNDCIGKESPTYYVKEVYTYQEYEGFALVRPERLAELEDKAAKWDELQHTLRRLKIC